MKHRLCLAVVFLAGCVPPSWQNRPPVTPGGSTAVATTLQPTPRQWPPATATYQGRTADFWGPLFLDRDDRVSTDAYDALYRLGPDAIPWALRGLDDDRSSVQHFSLTILGGKGEKLRPVAGDVVPKLVRFVESPAVEKAPRQKEGVKWPMERWPAEDCVGALRILGQMGPDAKAAIPSVRARLGSRHQEVREAAEAALKSLSG